LITSIWISPGVIEISDDGKAGVQVFVQLEGKQVWVSSSHAYEVLLFNLLALIAFGWQDTDDSIWNLTISPLV
jgi:hypothetical protein